MLRVRGQIARGFSLTELMVVVGIIAVLTAVLLPVLGRAREKANRAACASNLRQAGNLLANYSVDNRGAYPRTKYTAGAATATFTGAADIDPFAGTNVVANDVTAALFLLARTQGAPAELFVCPSTAQDADSFGG